jgi:cytochrome c oxidase cbb3-type subunit III
MKLRCLYFACGILGLAFCVGCDRLPGKPTPADIELEPGQIRDFAVLFRQNCSGCHGIDGKGNGAFALNNAAYLAIVSDDVLRKATSHGVPGTLMPAFLKSAGGTLSDEQIQILVHEMRVRWSKSEEFANATPPPYAASTLGDPRRGAAAYAAFCASCHGPDGMGTPHGSAIVDGSYLALVSDQGLRTLVIAGRPDLQHPDWRGYVPNHPLNAEEVTDLVSWLASNRAMNPGQPYPSKD